MTEAPSRRLGSAYFLAFAFFALVLLIWLRGFGRLLVPVLLIGLLGYAGYRLVQKIREPV